jgi:hypothetical protein
MIHITYEDPPSTPIILFLHSEVHLCFQLWACLVSSFSHGLVIVGTACIRNHNDHNASMSVHAESKQMVQDNCKGYKQNIG